jgi:two-component system NarL family response regulator
LCAEKVDSISVFLLAENRLLREALARVLDSKHDIRVVAAVAFDARTHERVSELRPRILAVDSSVYARAGLDLIESVRRVVPDTGILLVGMDSDKKTFLRCVRAGVSGYVIKDASANEVVAAVRSVACDRAGCPPKLYAVLFEQIANPRLRLYSARLRLELTRRERQSVKMIAQGLSNKEIANHLNLSEQTVKNHIHRILRKLGAADRLSAVEVCRVEGIVA